MQPIERETRRFNPLKVPAKLQKDLPFKSKPKLLAKRKKPSLATKRAVVMEPDEKKVGRFLLPKSKCSVEVTLSQERSYPN